MGVALVVSLILFHAPVPAQTRWHTSLEEGLAVRNATHKPALVFFFNDIARDCQEMRRSTFADGDVTALLQNFVCFELDAGKHQALARRYNIFKVPTVLFLDPRGTEVDRAVSFKSPDVFQQYLDRVNRASFGGMTQAEATRRQIERLSEIQPFKTATINILEPHPGTKAVTLSHKVPNASALSVVGDFNDWRSDATPMRQAVNGDWFVTIHVPDGVHEYKYLDNRGDYHEDRRNPLRKSNPYGTMNSILVIGDPMTSPLVYGPSTTFILYRPNAREVSVAGSFNEWKPVSMFRKKDNPALWGFRCQLPPGDYEYKYVIDGEWVTDPENYYTHTDTAGNINSLFAVR